MKATVTTCILQETMMGENQLEHYFVLMEVGSGIDLSVSPCFPSLSLTYMSTIVPVEEGVGK